MPRAGARFASGVPCGVLRHHATMTRRGRAWRAMKLLKMTMVKRFHDDDRSPFTIAPGV
jgi:hypothetical protein